MVMARTGSRSVCRMLLAQHRSLNTSVEPMSARTSARATGSAVCGHAPGTCVLCSQNAAPAGMAFFGRCFSSGGSESPSQGQQSNSSSKPSGQKESTSVGTDGGMLGERSGPSQEATPQDTKEEMEDEVEEQHVQQKKDPETAPWAS
ncbi:MAG: hypothetical protein FRX49_00393 [Trebouxia sp. A1-2]|nr:MAG: hypothetical protein FRX49_00393 [Trebouxia sp. A1-2]